MVKRKPFKKKSLRTLMMETADYHIANGNLELAFSVLEDCMKQKTKMREARHAAEKMINFATEIYKHENPAKQMHEHTGGIDSKIKIEFVDSQDKDRGKQ
jgi:hypothetical protein